MTRAVSDSPDAPSRTPDLASLLLSAFGLVMLASWLPHYLTWPWWADHDVFAAAARGWDAGLLPYRDVRCNNFPGTIYLFYGLGRVFGWGNTASLWACDAALTLAFCGLTLAWSRKRLGSFQPGLIACLATLGYAMSLDYSQAAQRDAHAPMLALGCVMLLDVVPGAMGAVLSGLAMAAALSIRPQAACFVPAAILAIALERRSNRFSRLAAWILGCQVGIALWLLPLVRAGVFDDFAAGIRMAAYGGSYSQAGPVRLVKELIQQALQPRFAIAVVVLSAAGLRCRHRAAAAVALMALAGVWVYAPASPIQHAYLAHPLALTWAWSLVPLTAVVLERLGARSVERTMALLVLLAMAAPAWPRFCNPEASARAVAGMARPGPGDPPPPGYTPNLASFSAGRYEWSNYRDLLDFLRDEAPPEARVANALRYTPAVAGPSGRLTALPAESIAWLTIVRSGQEQAFASSIVADPRTLVVWDPSTPPLPHAVPLPTLEGAIRSHYEPWRRYGTIEVWRRRNPRTAASHTRPGSATAVGDPTGPRRPISRLEHGEPRARRPAPPARPA